MLQPDRPQITVSSEKNSPAPAEDEHVGDAKPPPERPAQTDGTHDMHEIERIVTPMLLAGDAEEFATLRGRRASICDRSFSGVGFSLHFDIPPDVPRLDRERWVFGDVYAELEGLEDSVGFLLFIEEGRLSMFECHSTDDDWPPKSRLRRAYYAHHRAPGSAALVETGERDFEWLLGRVDR